MTEATAAPTDREMRQFGAILAVAVLVIFCMLPWYYGRVIPWWPVGVAAILMLFAATWPQALAPLYRGWMRVGHVLGWINTRVLLGAVFFLLIVPLGMVLRMLGKRGMARGPDPGAASYRIPTTDKDPVKDLTRPF
ncbi:MAG: SxtJ family membrane protein [Betaproteobacteria bacterium]